MNDIEKRSLEISKKCLEQLIKDKNYNLYIDYVEYVLENGVKILRVIVDSDEDISIDMVTELNELISNKLDKEDFIDEEYYLEVSSAGIEKELRNDEAIKKAVGSYIFFKTYEKIGNQKEFYGDLVSFDGNTLGVDYMNKNIKKHIDIEKDKISKIRLAIKF